MSSLSRATIAVLFLNLSLQSTGSTCSRSLYGETWIIAGQSNASGRSGWNEAPVPSPLHALARTGWGEIRVAQDPIDGPASPWRSPWPHFAAARLADGAPTPYLVQTAQGGTCLVYARQHGEPRWDPATGDLYQRMLDRVADARARGFPPVAGVLWHQGECEANLPLDTYSLAEIASLYRDGLLGLADAIGADLGVPLVAALIVPRGPREIAIRDAVIEAAALHPGIFVGPDVADLEHEADGLHVRDVVTLGGRWADAVSTVEGSASASDPSM